MRPVLAFSCCVLAACSTAAAAGFNVLDTTIDPAPDQQITVEATGIDAVMGMSLFVSVDGAPLVITGISITGSIWEGNNTGPTVYVYPAGGLTDAQFAVLYLTTAAGTVATPGVVAVLNVDATGLDGQTAVITANTDLAASDWADMQASGFEDGTITVRSPAPPPPNQPPAVDAGLDQTVSAGDLVSLHATASDPEGALLTCLWLQIAGPSVVLSSNTIADPTFTAPSVTTATAVEFQFRASDGSTTRTDTIVITVNPPPGDVADATDTDSPDDDPGQGDGTNQASADDPDGSGGTGAPDEPDTTEDTSSTDSTDTGTPTGNTPPINGTTAVSNDSATDVSPGPGGASVCAVGAADAVLMCFAGLLVLSVWPAGRCSRHGPLRMPVVQTAIRTGDED